MYIQYMHIHGDDGLDRKSFVFNFIASAISSFVEQSQTIHNSFDAIWLYHILNTHQQIRTFFLPRKNATKMQNRMK